MKRIVLAAIVALAAAPTFAATTWAAIAVAAPDHRGSRSVTATCTSGTESAPSGVGTTAAPVGMDLTEVSAYIVVVEAVTAGQTVANGWLRAYYYDAVSSVWVRIPDLDLTISATTYRGYTFLGSSPALGMPVLAQRGRIAYVPDTVTISAGSLTVTILSVGTRGEPL